MLLILLFLHVASAVCPRKENLAPLCYCETFSKDSMMTCNGLVSPEEMNRPLASASGMDIFSLTFYNSSILYIPANIFKNARFEMIHFARSQLMGLSETEYAFEGLEDILTDFRVAGTQYITHWDWSQLSKLRRITLIDITNVQLGPIMPKLPSLPSLKTLGITTADINEISYEAFRDLTGLVILDLSHNEINVIKRNMLPKPALHLQVLTLNHNKLKNIPANLFQDIPDIKEVRLSDNLIMSMEENPFAMLLGRLQVLYLQDNPLSCDCRMQWLVDARFPFEFVGDCMQPPEFQGVSLRHLHKMHLTC